MFIDGSAPCAAQREARDNNTHTHTNKKISFFLIWHRVKTAFVRAAFQKEWTRPPVSFPQKQMSIHEVFNQFACHYQNGPRREINLRTLKTLERWDRKTMRGGREKKDLGKKLFIRRRQSRGPKGREREGGAWEYDTRAKESCYTFFVFFFIFFHSDYQQNRERGKSHWFASDF